MTVRYSRRTSAKGQIMHAYRTHNCGELRAANAGIEARLSAGFTANAITAICCSSICAIIELLCKRVIEVDSDIFPKIEPRRQVVRPVGSRNAVAIQNLTPTGEVELRIDTWPCSEPQSSCRWRLTVSYGEKYVCVTGY